MFLSVEQEESKKESEAIDDINEYFGDHWVKLSEDEHEYRIRFNERYSLLFITHVVAYKKCAVQSFGVSA